MTSLKRLTFVLLLLTLGAVLGCDGAIAEPDWTYSGDSGPANWSSLSDDYATCGEGLQQSPVDISGYVPQQGSSLGFDYSSNAVSAANIHRQTYFTFGGEDTFDVGGDSYHLKSAHLHAPSEHRVGGESFAAELHMVHVDSDDNLAVVGVLFRVGTANDLVETMLNEAPEAGHEIDGELTLNAASLEPKSLSYYHYAGSKTTPPCDEPVDWYVLQTPFTLSAGASGSDC